LSLIPLTVLLIKAHCKNATILSDNEGERFQLDTNLLRHRN